MLVRLNAQSVVAWTRPPSPENTSLTAIDASDKSEESQPLMTD